MSIDLRELERLARRAKRTGNGNDLLNYWDKLRDMWRILRPEDVLELISMARKVEMTAPTDSFAAIVAELRRQTWDINSLNLSDRIERLDAEMRKELFIFSMLGNTEGMRALHTELAELRTRLAACEKDAERNRGMRREATRHHLSGGSSDICVTFNIGHDWMQHYDEDAFDAGVDTILATRASVPKDAATGDEGKSP